MGQVGETNLAFELIYAADRPFKHPCSFARITLNPEHTPLTQTNARQRLH